MARQPRSLAAVLATTVALALAACGGDGSSPTSPSSEALSGSGSSSTSGTTSGTSAGPSRASSGSSSPAGSPTPAGSPSPAGSDSSTGKATDPEVSVTPTADSPQSAAERAAGTRAADGSPSADHLRIPAVGLSTSIGPQGLRDGKVNPDAGEVIWFTGYDRARPGATGTTVIAGHVVNRQGPDEFAALEQLDTGDGIVLAYPGGEELRFEVTSTDIVDKDALTTNADVWGDNSSTRRVVLVTCDDQLGFREDGHRKANFVAVAELPS